MTPYQSVTLASHPDLFWAFETISHDSGGRAGHPGYAVHPAWAPHLATIEAALNTLTGDREASLDGEFSDFCIGDEEDAARIAARTPELQLTHRMLESWFDDWSSGPDGEELTEVPPLPSLTLMTADGGFRAWSVAHPGGAHTIVVVNEEGENPLVLQPGEKWQVGVLRDADAEAVLELFEVPDEELEARVAELTARDWSAR